MNAPDLLDTPRARELRRAIQAHRSARLKWSPYVLHFVMSELGFGSSLRDLPEHRLEQLLQIIKAYRPSRPREFSYDRHGRYMYSLQQAAGWSDTLLRQFMILEYKKTHWNLLTSQERSHLITTLKANISASNQPQALTSKTLTSPQGSNQAPPLTSRNCSNQAPPLTSRNCSNQAQPLTDQPK